MTYLCLSAGVFAGYCLKWIFAKKSRFLRRTGWVLMVGCSAVMLLLRFGRYVNV